MVVILLEKVPTTLKGDLSRWLTEVRPGVFLGHVSALVRDALFERCRARMRGGGVVMIAPAQTEQGFRVWTAGNPSREIYDHEGLYLVRERQVQHEEIDPAEPPF
jgi:CRISPR-associated protein Cas2